MARLGLIGCGPAAEWHAEVIRALGHDVAAVAVRPGSARLAPFAARWQARAYADWRALAREAGVDALVVAVPPQASDALAPEIAAAGLPVLFEKPVALSSRRLEQVRAAAGRAAGRIMVGYNRRFYDWVARAKARIAQQPPRSATLICPDTLSPAPGEPAALGPALLMKTSHWLDLVRHLLGPLELVAALGHAAGAPAAHALLQAAGRVPVHLVADYNAPSQISLTLTFTDEVWQACPAEALRIYAGMTVRPPSAAWPIRTYVPQQQEESITAMTHKPGFLEQMRSFLDSCVGGSRPLEGCSLAEAQETTALCEALAEALSPAGARA